jgi:peroxiredoxin
VPGGFEVLKYDGKKEKNMIRRQLIAIVPVALSMGAGWAKQPVPRTASELTIEESSGKKTLLSKQKGDVVLVQFLYTNCPHCQATAEVFSKLQKELGPRGLHVFGVAFNDETQSNPELVREFVTAHTVTFPVGVASRETVMSYLGISVMSRFVVPQVMVVDRKGVVRAQSELMGTPELQDEAYMRSFLEGLLKEGPLTTSKTVAAPMVASKLTEPRQ